MSSNVTQCPACESTFNTNSRVLTAAAGKVRCGVCLNVFEAIDNFLIPNADDAAALENGESVFVGNNPQEFFDPSRFITRSALTEPPGSEFTATNPAEEQGLYDELERSETVSEDFFTTVAEELHANQDGEKSPTIEDEPSSKNDNQLLDRSSELQTNNDDVSIDPKFEDEILESFAELAQAASNQPILAEPKQEANTKPQFDADSTGAIRARALETELNDDQALDAIPQENLAALGNMSAPVEFLGRKESRLLRNALLFLSIVILSSLLSGQYLWQRMELYSQLPQLRPLYDYACTMLSCELPDYTDIDSIRSENLTVQTHPALGNGLMLNTVIRNTAAFDQPFPILILSFNSSENSVIALREFSSSEYLDPRFRSVQLMPSMTPVPIGLAIMDPGAEAVNYTLAFR